MKVKLLVPILIGFAVLAPLLLLMLKSLIHGIQYPAPPVSAGLPPEGYIEVTLGWKNGESAVGWYHEGAPPAGPAMIYFHGNGENLETLKMGGLMEMLGSFGLPVLAVDYPGYGRSSGAASEESILQVADACVQWILQKDPSRGWIAAGWSLGAAVAVQAAARHPDQLKGLIVLSGWNSLQETGAAHFPGWLVRLLLSESYDSVSVAGAIHCPALIIHGQDDPIIPVALAKKLSAAIPQSHWVLLQATGHNDLLSNQRVREEMAAFLKNQM